MWKSLIKNGAFIFMVVVFLSFLFARWSLYDSYSISHKNHLNFSLSSYLDLCKSIKIFQKTPETFKCLYLKGVFECIDIYIIHSEKFKYFDAWHFLFLWFSVCKDSLSLVCNTILWHFSTLNIWDVTMERASKKGWVEHGEISMVQFKSKPSLGHSLKG